MKWIVVQTAFLGDVVLTLPLCVAIKRYDPEASVTFVTTPAASGIAERCDAIDEVVVFDKRARHRTSSARRTLARNLHASDATVLVPHKSFRTMMLVRDMRARRVVTFADAWTKWIADVRVPYPAREHDAQRHLALLQAVTTTTDRAVDLLPIAITSVHDVVNADAHIPEGTSPLIVLAPGSVWPTKQWPAESFRELAERCERRGMRVVVIGDASTRGLIPDTQLRRDTSGQTTLPEAAAIIAQANVVVSNDSAPVHLASMCQVPTVAIFGPTVPEFGFGPLGPNGRVVQRSDLACRPCSAHGAPMCPLGTHACMTHLSVDAVEAAINDLLHAHDENRHAQSTQTISTTATSATSGALATAGSTDATQKSKG
jgi:heptosyltransferase-2